MRAAASTSRTRPSGAAGTVGGARRATAPSPPPGLGGFAIGWFELGTVEWTSGANAGRRAEIAGHVRDGGIVRIDAARGAGAAARARATASSSAPAATSGSRPARRSSPTSPTSAASRTCPARTRWSATPRNGRRARGSGAVSARRSGARDRRRAVLARHALPRPGERAGRRLRLPRARARRLARGGRARSRSPSRPTAATGARPARARSSPRPRARLMIEIAPGEAGPGALLLFRMRAARRPSTVGIVDRRRRFIHAYERLGVVERAADRAWRRRAAFAFLFPQR